MSHVSHAVSYLLELPWNSYQLLKRKWHRPLQSSSPVARHCAYDADHHYRGADARHVHVVDGVNDGACTLCGPCDACDKFFFKWKKLIDSCSVCVRGTLVPHRTCEAREQNSNPSPMLEVDVCVRKKWNHTNFTWGTMHCFTLSL